MKRPGLGLNFAVMFIGDLIVHYLLEALLSLAPQPAR